MSDLIERAAMRLRFKGADLTTEEKAEIWAKLKNGTKEYWRDFVREILSVLKDEGK